MNESALREHETDPHAGAANAGGGGAAAWATVGEAPAVRLARRAAITMSALRSHRRQRAGEAQCCAQRPRAEELLAMVQAYRTTGGLVSCDNAAVLLRRHHEQPISRLARWIVAREVVSFPWETGRLVPLFQFELADMSPRPRVTQLLCELVDAFEGDLEVAAWFTRPNCWLRGALPLLAVEVHPEAVLQAARAQRYLARA